MRPYKIHKWIDAKFRFLYLANLSELINFYSI